MKIILILLLVIIFYISLIILLNKFTINPFLSSYKKIENNNLKKQDILGFKDYFTQLKIKEGFNDDETYKIELNGIIYDKYHIIEIPHISKSYNINEKDKIIKDVYKYDDCLDSYSESEVSILKKKIDTDAEKDIFYSGQINLCNGNTTVGNKKISLIKNKLCCVSGKLGNDNVFSNFTEKDKIIAEIFLNREWINPINYINYIDIEEENFFIKVKYCKFKNYKEEYYNKLNISTNQKYNSSTKLIGAITNINLYNLISMNPDGSDLFNDYKRNILACLWNDGKIILPNFYNKNDIEININVDNQLIKYNSDIYDTVKFSPYITIEFENIEKAKQFVATVLNKIQKNAKLIITTTTEPTTTQQETTTTQQETTTTQQETTTTQQETTTTQQILETNPNDIPFKNENKASSLPDIENFNNILLNKTYINDNTSNNGLKIISDSHFL
jgi:hypothetical protein